jgi:hypothetical protein
MQTKSSSRDDLMQKFSSLGPSSPGLSDAASQGRIQQVQYSDEMDWSPTQSPHRAFNDYGSTQRQTQGFNQAPTEPKSGPFWYKVPPAPLDPARRTRNPPVTPLIRSKVSNEKATIFRGATGRISGAGAWQSGNDDIDSVEFRESRFILPPDPGDPRNSLADLLTQSFSLNQERDESGDGQHQQLPMRQNFSRFSGLRTARLVDFLMLAFLLATWQHSALGQHEYRVQTMTGVMCICSTIAVRVSGDTLTDMRQEKKMNWVSVFGLTLGLVELVSTAYLGLQTWKNVGECRACEDQGVWIIGIMLLHQLWNALL